MSRVFADASYFFALLNPADAWHPQAKTAAKRAIEGIITTEWVLTEVASLMSRSPFREVAVVLIQRLQSDRMSEVVPADHATFERAFDFFASRPDKDWSLVDCTSFVVMQQMGIREALTTDKHFTQAGFVALLK